MASRVTIRHFIIHDGTAKFTTLKAGNVETVFEIDGAGGLGMNFASVEDLKGWLARYPSTDEEFATWSALRALQAESADFSNLRLVGKELAVPDGKAVETGIALP